MNATMTMQRRNGTNWMLWVVLILAVGFGIFWTMDSATMPRNDCGANWHLQLDAPTNDPCAFGIDLGIISARTANERTAERNAELDRTDPLPKGVDGFSVAGRIGAFDEIMAECVKFFMGW